MRPTHLRTPYKFDLSPRQVEVMQLMARGQTNAEIADALGITLDGAKYHVREILGKLGVESREEAVATWRESSSSRNRLQRWTFAFRSVPGLPVAVAGLGASVAGLVLLLAVVNGLGRGDDSDSAADSGASTATPSVVTTSSPSAVVGTAPSPGPSLAAGNTTQCGPAQASARLELVPDGQDVLIKLFIDGTGCVVLGEGQLSVFARQGAPTPPVDVLDTYANTERTFKLSLDLPAAGAVASWRWMNQCSQSGPTGWDVRVAGLRANVTATTKPGCVQPGLPMVLASEGLIDGDRAPGFPCKDRVAGWLCETALRISDQVLGGDLFTIVKQGGMTEYTCTGDGRVPNSEYSDLCEGRPGEVVVGYPVSRHGSHGGPESFPDTLATLQGAFDGGTKPYFAALGCPLRTPSCEMFVVAFATGGQPSVAYLVFERRPGTVPVMVAAGVSGDNADDILAGRTTMTAAGEVQFIGFGPPP